MAAVYIVNDSYPEDRLLAKYFDTKAEAEQAIENHEIGYPVEYSHLEIVRA